MVPRRHGADESAVFSTAEGIKNKMEQLHRRLQSCVGNLELVSGSTGSRQLHPHLSPKHREDVQRFNDHVYNEVMDVAKSGQAVTFREARQTSRSSALPDNESVQQDSQEPGLVGNNVSDPNSWEGHGSDEGEWEENPVGDELDEGLELCFEQLRVSPEPSSRSRYDTAVNALPETKSAPPVAFVSSALEALKRSLSPHVRSSFKGGAVPTHGEQLRVQYRKAVNDTVNKRLLGRADVFHSSGSLLNMNSSGKDSGAGNLTNLSGAYHDLSETDSRNSYASVVSPQRSLVAGGTARALQTTVQEPGQLRQQLANRPSIQVPGVGKEAPELEDGTPLPTSHSRDLGSMQRTAAAKSKIPPPPAVSRFAGGGISTSHGGSAFIGCLQTSISPQVSLKYNSRNASVAGDEQCGNSAANRKAESESTSAAASKSATILQHSPTPTGLRRESVKKDRFPSNGSSGSGALGWKFSPAESGGVMLIGVGSGRIDADDDDRVEQRISQVAASSQSSQLPVLDPVESARQEASFRGAGPPVVGFVPPADLLSGTPPISRSQPPVLGFVPPSEILAGSPTPSSTEGNPSIGFIPPTEFLGQSSATASAAFQSSPSRFSPHLELLDAARSGAHVSPSDGGVVPRTIASAHNEKDSSAEETGLRLSPFSTVPILARPAVPSAIKTAEIMGVRTDAAAMQGVSSPAQALAARIPIGDFSFGINTKVFASSSRLKTAQDDTDDVALSRTGGMPREGLEKVKDEDMRQTDQHLDSHQPVVDVSSRGSNTVFEQTTTSSDGTSTFSQGPATATAATAGASLEYAEDRHANETTYALRHRWSSDVSGGSPSNNGMHVKPSGKLPWEESSEDETRSPFASAMTTARTAQGNRSGDVADMAAAPLQDAEGACKPQPAPKLAVVSPAVALPLSQCSAVPLSEQGQIALSSAADEQESPLHAKRGISTATARLDRGVRSTGTSTKSLEVGPDPPALPAMSSLQSRLSATGTDPGVSITITASDIARTGGLVPALLEIVRERFRQKGFLNLTHMAGAGHGAAAVTEAGSGPLSPALYGETLTERIVARVETFHTRKSEDMVLALRPSVEHTSEGQRDRPADDDAASSVRVVEPQSISNNSDSVAAHRPRHSVSYPAPNTVKFTRLSGSEITAPTASPATCTRFTTPAKPTSNTQHPGDGGSERNAPQSSLSNVSAAGASGSVISSSPLGTAVSREKAPLQYGSASSRPIKSGASTEFQQQQPSGTSPSASDTPMSAHVGTHASTSPVADSSQKAEQGTQTGLLSLEPGAAPDSQIPLGTAREYFLSTTVPLTARSTGTHGGAYNADADKLLQPESPTICTAADFFRGAASRPTINTSTIAAPLRQLPAGSPSISPFATAATAEAALVASGSPRGGHSGGRPRSAHTSAVYSQGVAASRPRRQSTSGRMSVSTGGLLVRGSSRISSGGGRVMIDDEPVDMEALSSSRTTYAYISRRPSTVAIGSAPGHSVRVAFEDSGEGGVDRSAEPGTYPDRTVGRRALTREMLMRLTHLSRDPRHTFETTTEEEQEDQEGVEVKWRARRNRSSIAQCSPRMHTTGEDDFSADARLLMRPRKYDKQGPSREQRRRDHRYPGHNAHFESSAEGGVGVLGPGARGAMPRQLMAVAASEGDTRNSSPATAAAPGDSITLPPLSLDAPDMPEPCGGDAPACTAISVAANSSISGPVSGLAGSGSFSQIPHESVFIPPVNGWDHGGLRAEEVATGLSAANSTTLSAGRRAVQSAGGNVLESGGAVRALRTGQHQGSRFSRGIMATEGGSHQRRPHVGSTAFAQNTTTSWSNSSGGGSGDDVEDDGDRTVEGGALTQGQEHVRVHGHQGRSANIPGGIRAGRNTSDKNAVGQQALGPTMFPAARGLLCKQEESADWDLEEGLPSVPFGSFEAEVGAAERLDRDPSPLSISRGAISPSSAAVSMLSHQRYVAAARAHRSVSEVNSIKPLSSGALPADDDDNLVAPDEETLGIEGVAAAGSSLSGGLAGREAKPPQRQAHISLDRHGDVVSDLRLLKPEAGEGIDRQRGNQGVKLRSKDDVVAQELKQEGLDGHGLWNNARGDQAEPAAINPSPNGSRIRQTLQRLLDLRSSAASSGRAQSMSSMASEQSAGVVLTPKRPLVTTAYSAHMDANRQSAEAIKDAKVERAGCRSSPSPSVTATAGGTTEADVVERNAPLHSVAHVEAGMDSANWDAASTPRWRQARPATLMQQTRLRSNGSAASSGDAPPEDPLALVSPKYTQDMAEEEYGWDVATGDVDVDNLTSPHGRRPHGVSTSGGAPARRDRKTPPPPLPYDPSEVPTADFGDACPNFTRELEQQEMLDAVSELLGSLSGPASEGSPGAAEPEPSFSLDPRVRSKDTSRLSSPSLISGSWRESPRSGSIPHELVRQSMLDGSPQHTAGTPRSTSVGATLPSSSSAEARWEKTLSSDAIAEVSSETAGPSWLTALLNSPQLTRHKVSAAVVAAAVVQTASDGVSGGGGHEAKSATASPPRKQSSSQSMRTALADLLVAMQPLASRNAPAAAARLDAAAPGALHPGVEDARSTDVLRSMAKLATGVTVGGAASPTSRSSRQIEEQSGEHTVEAAMTAEGDRMASGRSSTSSNPDPELRHLLLTAWRRWYLRKSLGPCAGNHAEAVAAAAAAQARLQALAAAHSRAGSEAWDGVSPSIDMLEAANDSRLHITFIRWLGHARASRRSMALGGRRWAEPRSARSWNHSLSASGPTNIAPPYPTSLTALPTQLAALVTSRAPSSPQSVRPVETTWSVGAALRAAAAPASQPIGSYPGAVSQPTKQYNATGSATITGSPQAGGAIGPGAYSTSAVRPADSSVISTPTVSRSSGVLQVTSQHKQVPQRHPSRQHPHLQLPTASIHPSPRQQQQQQQQLIQSLQQPPAPQLLQPQVAAWLPGSSWQQYQRPATSRSATPRSWLEQQHTAAAAGPVAAGPLPAASALMGSHTSMAAVPGRLVAPSAASHATHADMAGIDSARDLESLIAMRLLDGLGSGSDGVILAGLELATGSAFESDKSSFRGPSPHSVVGGGDSSAMALATTSAPGSVPMATAAAQGASSSAWVRPQNSGRTSSLSTSQHTVVYGGNVLNGGPGGGGSILERTLLTMQQPHSPGTVSGGSRPRTTASPRLGTASGGGASSAGGSLARGIASPRLASPRPGVSGVGLVGYSGAEAGGVGGLLGNGSLGRAPPSPRLGTGSGGGGGNRFDLLRAVPPSPRPSPGMSATGGFIPAGTSHPGGAVPHGGSLRSSSVGGAGSVGGGRLQVTHASPRSPMRSHVQAWNDNIRANEPGADQLNFAYYGLRP